MAQGKPLYQPPQPDGPYPYPPSAPGALAWTQRPRSKVLNPISSRRNRFQRTTSSCSRQVRCPAACPCKRPIDGVQDWRSWERDGSTA